jgi:phage terminase small subunit
MPALAKVKYEVFAQEIAKGRSAADAYVIAGYRPSAQNAGNLRNKKEILLRVKELMDERDQIYGQSTAKAIESAALTKTWVITHLMENALTCLGKQTVKVVVDGAEIETYDRNPNAANRALELLGRELNMFVERVEHGSAGEFARMTEDELSQDLLNQAGKLGIEPAALQHLLTYQPKDEPEPDAE